MTKSSYDQLWKLSPNFSEFPHRCDRSIFPCTCHQSYQANRRKERSENRRSQSRNRPRYSSSPRDSRSSEDETYNQITVWTLFISSVNSIYSVTLSLISLHHSGVSIFCHLFFRILWDISVSISLVRVGYYLHFQSVFLFIWQ